MQIYQHSIPFEFDNQRIDKVLTQLCKPHSRSTIQKAIKNAQLTVNEALVNDFNYKVRAGDQCVVRLVTELPAGVRAENIPLDIKYEDDDLLVINKPRQLTVHPGAGCHNNTLVNALLYHTNELANIDDPIRPGIVHRLDRDTTGLMIVAKNNVAHAHIAEQIQTRQLIRKYKALVWGRLLPFQGCIDLPMGRCRNDRTKMQVVQHGGKTAITHYQVLELLADQAFSLVECKLETGRTHQIRVHLSHLGHSIVGDQVYGNNRRKAKANKGQFYDIISSVNSQALHAYYLSFTHPVTNQVIELVQELPPHYLELLEKLRRL